MLLAVIGSEKFTDFNKFSFAMDEYMSIYQPTELYTLYKGGIDSFIGLYVKNNRLSIRVIVDDESAYEKMINESDGVVFFVPEDDKDKYKKYVDMVESQGKMCNINNR